MRITLRYKGGKGSGHHGHAGRPGDVGGSVPGIGGFIVGVRVVSDYHGPGVIRKIMPDGKVNIKFDSGAASNISPSGLSLEGAPVKRVSQEPSVQRAVTPTDVFDMRANAKVASTGRSDGVISDSVGTFMKERIYDAELANAPDPYTYVEDTYAALADGLGIDVKISVVDDATFNGKFKGAKMSKFGQRMGGVNAITAGYRSDDNMVYFRRRNVDLAKTSMTEYRLFRYAAYHELGHAYHANVWNIKYQDTGAYGSGFCEQFADSFCGALAGSDQAARAIRFGKAPTAELMRIYKKVNVVTSLNDAIRENAPPGVKK